MVTIFGYEQTLGGKMSNILDDEGLIKYVDELSREIETDKTDAFDAMWRLVGYLLGLIESEGNKDGA